MVSILGNLLLSAHGVSLAAARDMWVSFSDEACAGLTTQIEVLADFVRYCSSMNAGVAVSAFGNLHGLFCSKDDIHVVVQNLGLSQSQTRTVLKGYFSAWKLLEQGQQLPAIPCPALFADPMAICLVPRYMSCSTVAVPLVALIQIMHLAVLYKTLRINPGELVRLFKGAIGHSQGLIIAALFATATDEASFYASAEKGLGILTVSSAGSYIDYPPSILGDSVLDDALANGEQPSPMVSIRGLAKPYVEQLIHRFNQCNSSPIDHVHIALINNRTHVVVGGVLESVICFVKFIREVCKSPKEDQSHIPVSQRKPVAMVDYLASSVICHSPLMRSVAKWVYPYVVSKGFLLEASGMQIPVSAGHDGHDLRNEESLTKALVDSMGEYTVDWPVVVKGVNATHIVDFSPGGFSIFALLTRSILEGSGTTVICPPIGSKADLYQSNMGSIVKAPNFALSFGPRLVRTAHDAQVHIDTPMFRVLGQPPGDGVSHDHLPAESTKFVAAINRAGYHAELTVSCRETALQLREKVSDLLQRVEPGQLVTICLNHTIQRHWTELFPAILRMRHEGIPIGGLSISGGIPPLKVAIDLVARFHDAGIAHAALRPSTIADIRTVLAIAKSRSEYPISMLWAGGRCGGYHSWEDFHQPILEMYGQIRSQKNIVLIAASGIGNWESALPYISGEWSRVFGRFPMPFDGIALGSRLMNGAVKELIVAVPGVADSEWDSSCTCTAGGVISIVSESGTPMHVLATRAAVLIKDLQTGIFSLPVDSQLELIREKREHIIQRLNSDYLKPWFGCRADSPISELEDMAYSEVVRRMVDLMFDQGQSRWVHESFRSLVAKFIRRIEDRFSGTARECVLVSIGELIDPLDLISDIERAYPDMVDQLLTSEDIIFFLELCKQADPMPVPFVPHLDSVIGNDPQKVIVCQGPVSAQYSTIINEPVQVILDDIYHSLVSALVDGQYAGNESIIPVTDYIGAEETECPALPSVNQSTRLLPGHDQWLERCLLSSPHILQRQNLVSNGVRQLLCPSVGQTVVVSEKEDVPDRMTVFSIDGQPDVIAKIDERCIINIAINGYEPSNMAAPIIEIMEDRDERIAEIIPEENAQNIRAINPADLSVGFEGDAYMVTSEAVQSLCESVGSTSHRSRLFSRHQVPIDLLYTIFQPYVGRNWERHIHIGDVINTVVRPVAIMNSSMGSIAKFRATFSRHSVPFAIMDCEYVCRGQPRYHIVMERGLCIAKLTTGKSITLGSRLYFDLKSQYRYTSTEIYSSVVTCGPVYLTLSSFEHVHIADIDYATGNCEGNPVIAYLDQHSAGPKAQHRASNGTMDVTAPSDNWKYSQASGDYTAIHNNAYIAKYVGLPSVITHGMWTAGSTRALVEHPQRMRSYAVDFVDAVMPGDCLTTTMHHVGMANGLMLVEGETSLRFSAKIEQPNTAYFIGMGAELYSSSAAAKSVWDRADKHMFDKYGVSLLTIVRSNPKAYRVKFDGKLGAKIRANYLSLVRHDGGYAACLFPGISEASASYTHRCANGLLNAALFTQPIQTVMSIAQGLIQKGAAFAGHSLGEFGSLAAIAEIVSIEDAVDIALYRGLLLHSSVARDSNGLSEYAMVSVNPKCVGDMFDESVLLRIQLLEVINYNVRMSQYVVTGHVSSLKIMGEIPDSRYIHALIACADGRIEESPTLKNGTATTVVPGVDVPSHSFRQSLASKISKSSISYDRLHKRYIPNLTGLPFELSKGIFGDFARMLESWENYSSEKVQMQDSYARTLVIELLAYQIASPVQWVGTQATLFHLCGTLAAGAVKTHNVTVLHVLTNPDAVYYKDISTTPNPLGQTASESVGLAQQNPTAEYPVQMVDVLLLEIPKTKSIKELVAGKSTPGLQKELGKPIPDNGEDIPLHVLAKKLGTYSGSLGRYTMAMFSRLVSTKFPGSISQSAVRHHLKSAYGLGTLRQNGSQQKRLPDDEAAYKWLDSVAQVYAQVEGITFNTTNPNSAAGANGSPVSNAAVIEKVESNQRVRSLEHSETRVNELETQLGQIRDELGDSLVDGSSGKFNKLKARRYSSYWNWARQDALEWIYSTIVGGESTGDTLSQRAFNLVEQVYKQCEISLKSPPVYRALFRSLRPRTTVTHKGEIVYTETPREDEPCVSKYIENMHSPANARHSDDWTRNFSKDNTGVFFNSLMNISETALITGCGQGSIGSGVLEALLSGGAKVIATTSNYCRRTTRYFEDIYRRFGARGSELVLVPFNQGSSLDVKALDELGWDLDYIRGRDLANIDSHSELAMRVSLTNLFRLLGERNLQLSPTLVVLPHSSNYGVVGNDGLYSIAKIGLQTLYRRWYAEDWGKYLLLTGADIGWVRNTNMTSDGAIIYEDIERVCRTFSREEMSLNLIALLSTPMARLAAEAPVFGNFNGGTASTMDAQAQMMLARNRIDAESSLKKAILSKLVLDGNVEGAGNSGSFFSRDQTVPLANHRYEYPPVKPYEQLGHLRYLQVVIVSGFGEVGPFGNSALRWEMEAYGEFSLEGCIELAWIMGLIKHFSAHHPLLGKHYIGWPAQYEQYILDHCGIRVVEPELHDGYDPNKKSMMRELQIAHDLEPFETTAEEAANFKLGSGDKVDVWENSDGSWSVMLRKGTALRFDRYVAAQLPTGWDPTRFGIPEAMLEHIDPVTSYALVATMESLIRSGIADPYEIYQYLHNIFRGRWMDKGTHVETGVEATTNCISAWINMMLLSAAGSLKPPVGASAKAKIMIVGASDSFAEDSAYEFGQLGATASAESDARCGREPTEMSRPCTATRGGFIEGYGSGIAVLMSASVALEMGAPVYGILALSSMATDKAGRNLTAPGQGLMTVAREQHSELPPVLDFGYRRRMLSRQLSSINEWRMEEIERVRCANSSKENKSQGDIDLDTLHQQREALNACGNDFWKGNPHVSPLRGALATWGLDIDSISVATFHGTSTQLNDRNESDVVNKQMRYLGRTPGLPIHVVCQKWLTGHSKGVAASWMLNGLLKSMTTGIIPGNANADDIDSEFEKFEYLVYPNRSIRVPHVKAGLLTSFGFGQVGGEIVVIHPDYLFATQTKEDLEMYKGKVERRQKNPYRYLHDTFVENHTFIQPKETPPFTPEQELGVYLDPLARTRYDRATGKYCF
ncbi:hypothetical protein DL89DRAFT_264942 [Linderina pennispora]|uniref:Ketosynthase family 3 (KS3) domain-containing protein n=1 Tax=Linderina pennispora TaxID=61395 RepID=A0A1Y1WHY0_9FUNG|nr:uncharacterized protein DL89DRAFT_264942 [Linderina pennispora]ORX72734.1 hypothetical protein DL89DRAFT_264942 [Linderina pennispora]